MFNPAIDIEEIKTVIKSKLGFIIETKLNRDFLKIILDNNFNEIEYILTFAVNHASLHGSFPDILEFYRQGYEHVFFMFETNTFDKETIQEQIEYFKKNIKAYGLDKYVTFIPIRPHFQAWIRPKMKTFIEEKHHFKLFGIDPKAIPMDIDLMKKEVPDFKHFVEQVESFLKRK